jgi:uncharacterized membrane protein (DUF373 family)
LETDMAKKIQTFAQKAERFIIHALIFMMATVLVLATFELAFHIARSIITPPYLLLDYNEILDLFGIFLLVLIGIELLDTIKIYFKDNVVHVEVVVLVAIIAISRKVIVLEPGDYEPGTLIGIGIIILALAISYFLIKKLGSEIINIKQLPKASQDVIKDEIKESQKILTDDDNMKINFSEELNQQKDFATKEDREQAEKKRSDYGSGSDPDND